MRTADEGSIDAHALRVGYFGNDQVVFALRLLLISLLIAVPISCFGLFVHVFGLELVCAGLSFNVHSFLELCCDRDLLRVLDW